jgi:transcriptional regulator with XRE-family HTH domain
MVSIPSQVMVGRRLRPYGGRVSTTARASVGDLIRHWRIQRRMSQLDLAVESGVSTRHLSFVETGKARPSPELVLLLAEHLAVPLRERNGLLLAAGYAPRFTESSMADPSMAAVAASVRRMLDAHDPYPAVVVDRSWNLVDANDAALALTALVAPHLLEPPINVVRLTMHADGLAGRSPNVEEWAGPILQQLRRQVVLTGDADLEALVAEVSGEPIVRAALERRPVPFDAPPILLVPFRLDTPRGELSLFTTLTTFGTPMDVTLDELIVELFWPADESTATLLRAAT